MIHPTSMTEMFDAPAYLINLDHRPDRLRASLTAIGTAGYRRVVRFTAVDGSDAEALARAWAALGDPPYSDAPRHRDFWMGGHQGCFLSHLLLWVWIARGDAPFATVFEDDVLLHPAWLAPEYLRRTPPDGGIVHLGHHAYRDMGAAWAARMPVQSTAAYMVTRAGAAAIARAHSLATRGRCHRSDDPRVTGARVRWRSGRIRVSSEACSPIGRKTRVKAGRTALFGSMGGTGVGVGEWG